MWHVFREKGMSDSIVRRVFFRRRAMTFTILSILFKNTEFDDCSIPNSII